MANPTSAFGWQMPTNTDLVKDLPADFEVFGQAVDTSLADLKGGTTGQVLSKASNTDMDFTWINNDTGDVTEVIAGTGLSGGGTSGSVTVSLSSPVAATLGGTNQTTYSTGDIIYASAANTLAKRTIGTSGQVLTVSGGIPTWATAATPSYTWTSYTPTLTQSATVNKTVTTGKYLTIGKVVHFECYLKITSSGTAGNNILIGLPVARVNSNDMVGGVAYLYDASAGLYYRSIVKFPNENVAAMFSTDSTAAGYLGSDIFTAAVANLDEIAIFGSYEIA